MDRQRLDRIRNVHTDKGYGALVMRPLAVLVMIVIADWRWLTANMLTSIGNVFKLGGAALIFFDNSSHLIAGIIALQIGLLFDHLDGTKARYSDGGSVVGSYYDKLSDAVTWVVIASVIGIMAYREYGDPYLLILAVGSAYAMLCQGYTKWLLDAELGRLAWFEAKQDPNAAVDERTRKKPLAGPPERGPADWARFVALSLVQMCKWDELDLYFWTGVFLLVGRLDLLVYGYAVSQGAHLLYMSIQRGLHARDIDRRKRALA